MTSGIYFSDTWELRIHNSVKVIHTLLRKKKKKCMTIAMNIEEAFGKI